MKRRSLVLAIFSSYAFLFAKENPFSMELSTFLGYEANQKSFSYASYFSTDYKLSFLQFDDFWTAENGVNIRNEIEFTFITLSDTVSVVFTPVIFLELEAGSKFGTGWRAFGTYGVAEYIEETKDSETIFPSLYVYPYATARFLFDMGEIFCGDWSHIFFVAEASLGYQKLYGTKNKIWQWQGAYNRKDGFSYQLDFTAGYKMPVLRSTVGIFASVSNEIVMTNASKIYAIDPFVEFEINKKNSVDLLFDFATVKNGDWTLRTLGLSLNHKF